PASTVSRKYSISLEGVPWHRKTSAVNAVLGERDLSQSNSLAVSFECAYSSDALLRSGPWVRICRSWFPARLSQPAAIRYCAVSRGSSGPERLSPRLTI